MADMTITITVTSSAGGNTINWSRTATVADLLSAVHKVSEGGSVAGLQVTAASESTTSALGYYSTGLAVLVAVHTSVNSHGACQMQDSSRNSYYGPVLPAGVPFIAYNNAGAGGFSGGVNYSNTATDTPTVDIDGALFKDYSGACTFTSLGGLKLIS